MADDVNGIIDEHGNHNFWSGEIEPFIPKPGVNCTFNPPDFFGEISSVTLRPEPNATVVFIGGIIHKYPIT